MKKKQITIMAKKLYDMYGPTACAVEECPGVI